MKLVCGLIFSLSLSFIFGSELDSIKPLDEHNILEAFHHGHLKGQIRDYSMLTLNAGVGEDFYAQAIGASLHYQTANFYGFSLGLKGLFIHRVFSNDLDNARFERQLFDLEDPSNYNELDRLEELYINYQYKNTSLSLGKMDVKSPIINKHDGRMKPKMFSGFMGNYRINKLHNFRAYYLSKASPRSTVEWFDLRDAIGIYNNGYNAEGEKMHYHGELDTKALVLLGYEGELETQTEIKFWEYYLENLSSTTQLSVEQKIGAHLKAKATYLNQIKVQSRENEFNREYLGNEKMTHVFSALLERDFTKWKLDVIASFIPDEGIYVFPRELGVDPFYTSVTRNWLEGFSDAKTIGFMVVRDWKDWEVKLSYVHLQSQNDYEKNRYMEVSNDQVNIDILRHFHHALEGLDLRFLYVMKYSGQGIPDYANEVNRTNFHHLNLIMNFNF